MPSVLSVTASAEHAMTAQQKLTMQCNPYVYHGFFMIIPVKSCSYYVFIEGLRGHDGREFITKKYAIVAKKQQDIRTIALAKTEYRTFQHWDHWLTHHLGKALLEAETNCLKDMLKNRYGKHSLLIGVPQQSVLLDASSLPFHWLLTPLIHQQKKVQTIEGDFHELPIASGVVDLVMLPHTLEFVANPRQVLAEACRIVKPEGFLIITGFNPLSFWGMKRFFSQNKKVPWSGSFNHTLTIQDWLKLADFELTDQRSLLFRPPLSQQKLFEKLYWMERFGKYCFKFFGSIYILIAQAKAIPLTPIRMNWKQTLASFPVSTTVTGPTTRNFS